MSSTQCNSGGTGSDCQSREGSQHPPGSVLIGSNFVGVVGSPPNVSLQPPPKAAPPNPTTCWICNKKDVRDTAFCLDCDSDANHAHIACIVDRARTKNEEDYCNICKKDNIGDQGKKSLKNLYKSIKSKIEDPRLKCGQCGEKHRGSTEKILADEFFKCYMGRGSTDIRLCFAF